MKLNQTDGHAMKQAMLTYLRANPGIVDRAAETRLAGSKPFIDPDGYLRIGEWLVESRNNDVTVTRRRREGSYFFLTVALLEHSSERRWQVRNISHERHSILR